MRSEEEVALVLELVRARWNDCEIARETGIPRGTVRGWRIGRTPNFSRQLGNCALCSGNAEALPLPAYPYLLGLYLGDGYITACPRNVYKLRIVCAARYPDLIRQCELAMAEVLPNKVGRIRKTNEGCWEVYSFSKHWPCLSPARARPEARAEDRADPVAAGTGRPRPAAPGPWAAPLRRMPGAELGERDAVPALPLQQRVGGHPRALRSGL